MLVHPHPSIEYNGGDDQDLDWTLLEPKLRRCVKMPECIGVPPVTGIDK